MKKRISAARPFTVKTISIFIQVIVAMGIMSLAKGLILSSPGFLEAAGMYGVMLIVLIGIAYGHYRLRDADYRELKLSPTWTNAFINSAIVLTVIQSVTSGFEIIPTMINVVVALFVMVINVAMTNDETDPEMI